MLDALDWSVMALYGAVVLAIGWRANRRQRSAEDYYLGGRRLRWWAVGVSLVATSFSSASLIGGTGYGFEKGMGYLQLQIGDLVALGVVCALFLPYFSGLRLTTAYEFLERRFGVKARSAAAALFLGQTLLRASILIYGPALALSTVLGWSVPAAILVTAAAAIVYSACGGIAAVVWTDLIQMAVIVVAVAYSLVLVAGDVPGGLGAVLDHASRAGRLHAVDVSADPSTPYNLLGSLVPYAVLACSLFGTGQQAVQRFLSCRDLRAARRAALVGWTTGTLALALTLFLGTCLASWTALVPEHASLGALDRADRILPAFIAHVLPAGVRGLMLAAVFAASMSSLDSAIHSMSTSFLVDFVRRFSRRALPDRAELRLARAATAGFGVLATGGALLVAGTQTGLLDTMITWLGYLAGPLLGLFLLGILTRRTGERAALAGVGVASLSIGALLAAGNGRPPAPWHPLWLAPFSCLVTFLAGVALSRGRPAPGRRSAGGPAGERARGQPL